MDPILNGRFGEVVISKELDRLYFDVVMSEGKDKFGLHIRKKMDDWKYYVIRLKGSKHKQNALRLKNEREKKEVVLKTFITIN